ncbi:MAG TPA: hypothetical protein VKR56_14870 [Candidatus Cybelea sp.]|nr:hypothetical protein [Candidatus Cybelea sp.]
MQRSPLLWACVLACAGLLPLPARSGNAIAAATPPPQIYHIVTTALCARLHEAVRPAVAMILQNDGTIAKSPPLFKRYARAVFENGVASGVGGDSMNNTSPATSMTLQQMSYLVSPIARNLISAQTLLDDEKLLAPTGNPADDATLAQIKKQLLETVAFQSASLDLINGFVQTQQMGELQHAGEEYIAEIQGTDTTDQPVRETPNPWQDPNTPGISQNPYSLDPSQIPGLAVGYNPLSHIMDGMQWLQSETAKREDVAGKSISAALSQCPK